ncbi:MAG TPA: protein kinase [Chthoniobacterales bacterium]
MPNDKSSRRFQHYEILARPDGSPWELRRDPIGITYKARDINLGIIVALKVIDAHLSGRSEVRHRFLTEARAAAQILHPNVARVFHFGTVNNQSSASREQGSGDCFYAREFVEGESLEERVKRAGRLQVECALEITRQVAKAIVSSERRGLSHGQLQPANVILVNFREPGASDHGNHPWVKIIEYGLAGLQTEKPERGAHEEAHDGEAPFRRRSDIYSLGRCVWFALAGESFAGDLPRATCLSRLIEYGVPAKISVLLAWILAGDDVRSPTPGIELIEEIEEFQRHNRRERARDVPAQRWTIAAMLAVLAVLVAIYLAKRPPEGTEKSIAVLPFRNLSHDPANAFFAEGVQDDILSRLIKIHDLRVVSRLGAAQYPADKPRDLRRIGHALGVRHLLEGSLRREGDRVRLHVSLVDSRDSHEIWSEGYDRTLADAINLQGELAADIADALDATLSPHEKVDIRAQSTTNTDAYVLYLRGRNLERSPIFQIADYEAAQALYDQAVTIDPQFALAHARLSSTLGLLYRFRGPNTRLAERAHGEAEKALRLQPQLGEAHLAKALCYYRIERDFSRALPELEIANHLLPNDTEAESIIAYIKRRQGCWRAARGALQHASVSDPINRTYQEELTGTAMLTRDWKSASQYIDRAINISPTIEPLRIERALIHFWRSGDLAPLQDIFSKPSSYGDSEGNFTWARWDAAMMMRNFDEAQSALDEYPFETLPAVLSGPIPKSYLRACVFLARGEASQAWKMFEMARPSMEAETRAHPDDSLRHARLGLLYAYMNRSADAVLEGRKAAQLTPISRDALDGHQRECNLALIYARIGENDRAISMVGRLLRQPGCVCPLNEATLAFWDLRVRWQWDPLRNDARFQQILAGPEPATIY